VGRLLATGSGGFAPRERLASFAQHVLRRSSSKPGGKRLSLTTQADRREFGEFVEHVRFSHAGVTFATVHLLGSRNGLRPFPTRTAADDKEVQRRAEAATAWLRESFAEAAASGASAVIVAFHGTLGFGQPTEARAPYEPFATAFEEEVERFGKPVLAIHGDAHRLTIDHPLGRRTTGRWLPNFTRLEVPGSPDVGCSDRCHAPRGTALRVPAADRFGLEVSGSCRRGAPPACSARAFPALSSGLGLPRGECQRKVQ
jgi:hypothetical protein